MTLKTMLIILFVAACALLSGCETLNVLRIINANSSINPIWQSAITSDALDSRYIGEKPYIYASVNGKPLLFLLDSGASFSILFDTPKVKALALSQGYPLALGGWGDQQDSQAYQTPVKRFDLGKVHFENIDMAYIPIATSQYFLRPDEALYDGVIGHDILHHFSWTFDKTQQLISLSKQALKSTKATQSFELKTSFSKISIKGKVDFGHDHQVTRDLVVDTGSRHYLKLSAAYPANKKLILPTSITAADFGLSGRTIHQRIAMPELTLGSIVLNEVKTNLIPSDDEDDWWVIGNALLNQFILTIDYPGNTLYLTPVQPFKSRFNLIGLELRKIRSGEFVVRYVLPGLPAAKADFKEGDLITEINGIKAINISLDQALDIANTSTNTSANTDTNINTSHNICTTRNNKRQCQTLNVPSHLFE